MQRLYLTRRNLQTLLNKLDRNKLQPGSSEACLAKTDTVHPKYPCSDAIYVYALEDAEYYGDRLPGEVLPADDPTCNPTLIREWLVDLVLHNVQSDGVVHDPLYDEVVHVSSGDLGTSFTHTRTKPTQPPPTSREPRLINGGPKIGMLRVVPYPPKRVHNRVSRMMLRGWFLTKVGWDKK